MTRLRTTMLCAALGVGAALAVTAWLPPDALREGAEPIATESPPPLDRMTPGSLVAPAVRGEDTGGVRAGRASAPSGPGAPGGAGAPRVRAAEPDGAASGAAADPSDESDPALSDARGDVLGPELELDAPLEDEPARTTPPAAALVAAGFEPERAAEIAQRAAALAPAAAAAELASTGTIRAFGGSAARARAEALRTELGEADYERYLAAAGQATRVTVAGIAADSPAQHAGIAPGDVILSYAGRRVFNQRELNALASEGTSGELVTATVLRDGQPLELYVARGPLGLTP